MVYNICEKTHLKAGPCLEQLGELIVLRRPQRILGRVMGMEGRVGELVCAFPLIHISRFACKFTQ